MLLRNRLPDRLHVSWLGGLPAWPLVCSGLLLFVCWLALWLFSSLFTQPWPFQLLFAVAFAAFCWALLSALRLRQLPLRTQATVVLAGALLFQVVLLPAPFAFSDDIFRYVWDGRVSASGIDPYRYAPGDPALAGLRDTLIWPNVNAKEQPSPYPPLLEATFALLYRLHPESLLIMKAGMICLNMAVVALLLALLWRRGQPPILALLYAWNPQVIFQVGFSGHNEPLMLFFLLLGLVLGQRGPPRWASGQAAMAAERVLLARRMLAAWALALATLAKLVPLLVLPLLWRRWGWRAAAVYGATLAAVYGALLLRGQQVLSGVLYEAETAQFNDGIYFLLYRIGGWLGFADPHLLARFAMLLLFGAVLLLLWQRPGDDLVPAFATMLATYVLLTPSVAPWYALWVLPFVALDALPRPSAHLPRRTPLLASYWLIFSWTAAFSELFYFADLGTWRLAHLLVYALPIGALSAGLLLEWAATRPTRQADTPYGEPVAGMGLPNALPIPAGRWMRER